MPNWIGLPELILIFLIILLLFGANRLPDIARSLGKSIREFKKSSKEISDEISKDVSSDKEEKKDKKS